MPAEMLPAAVDLAPLPGETPAASPAPRRRTLSAALLHRPIGALLVLVTAVLAAYAPSLDGQFLWDDIFLVQRNLLIRSPLFCLEVFRHTLFDNDSNFYRPTQTLTFLANYWVWGLDPFGYHLTSILIHAANAVLLFVVLRGVLGALLPPAADGTAERAGADCRTGSMALVLALLWAVHPVHSAAVAYVSGSADSLAMCCCLAAWLACERALSAARSGARLGWGTLAFAGLLLGLCSKEIAGIWLVIFGIYLFAVRPGLGSRRARLAMIAGSALALALYVGLRHLPPPALAPPPPPRMPAKWLLMLRALGDYGSLMVYPKELFMERQVFAPPGQEKPGDDALYLSLAISGVGMLAAFAAGAWWPGRGRRLRRFGAGWFLLGFLPVSNLIPLNASVAEHWLYLPSIGFLLFLAGIVVDLPLSRLLQPDGNGRRAALPAVALALAVLLPVLALGKRTWSRSFDWLDEMSFYRQTVRDAGDVPRARMGLATSLSRQHDEKAAIALMRQITARYPKVLTPRINLASALIRQGQAAEAKSILEKALGDFAGHDNNPHEVVAVVADLDQVAGTDPAWPARKAALLADTLRRHPDTWDVVLIGIQPTPGIPPTAQALAKVSAFADAHWWHGPARFQLGCMEAALGRTADALAAFRQAARLDVHDDNALAAAAELCLRENRIDEAVTFQQGAVRRQPDSPQQRFVLARILQRHGDTAQADQQLAMATALVRLVRP